MSAWSMADDIARVRSECSALASVTDAGIEGMYSWWSEETHFAGWLNLSDFTLNEFREWLTKPDEFTAQEQNVDLRFALVELIDATSQTDAPRIQSARFHGAMVLSRGGK